MTSANFCPYLTVRTEIRLMSFPVFPTDKCSTDKTKPQIQSIYMIKLGFISNL